MKYIRYLSILLGVLSVTLPPMLAHWIIAADPTIRQGGSCSFGIVGVMLLMYFSSAMLSLFAGLFSYEVYRKIPKPRPSERRIELAILSFPFLFIVPYLVLFFAMDGKGVVLYPMLFF